MTVMTGSIKELLNEAHVKLDRAEKSYLAFDKKLDKLLEKGSTGSKFTPVYALLLLAVTFWAGCQVGGL